MTRNDRVYFANHNFGSGAWGEVMAGEKWVRRDGFIRRRYLFRKGGKSLTVFSPVPWAAYDAEFKPVPPYPGEPRTHHAVWSYLAEFDPSPLVEELGCETDEDGRVTEAPVGEDSGPIV